MAIKLGTIFYRNEECISFYVPENVFVENWKGGYGTANSPFVYVLDMNTDCGFKRSFA